MDQLKKWRPHRQTLKAAKINKEPFSFADLPAELRLLIWRSCWEPRIVELYSWMTDEAQDSVSLLSSDVYRSTSKPPQTLFICRESRYETLKHYKRSFAALYKEPTVYFNFEIDTLYLRNADVLRFYNFSLTFPHDGLDMRRFSRIPFISFFGVFGESSGMSPEQKCLTAPGSLLSTPKTPPNK
jgi:hypothetical protein